MKQSRGTPGLVTLQVSNQVPLRLKIAKPTTLPLPLLHSVLAEIAQACRIRRPYRLRRMRLRHPDQCNLLSAASSTLRGTRNPLANPHQILTHGIDAHRNQQPPAQSSPHYFFASLLSHCPSFPRYHAPVAALRISS